MQLHARKIRGIAKEVFRKVRDAIERQRPVEEDEASELS